MAKTPAKMPKDRPDEKKAKSVRRPVNELFPVNRFVKLDDEIVELRRLTEIVELLGIPDSLDKEKRDARIVRAVELYDSLEPADGAETMLAAQMVGTHTAALNCLQRAAHPSQTFAGQDMALKHAQKLMTLYAKQLDALNKHRGKGQQKITVRHVNVGSGGQAIVGNVDVHKSDANSSDQVLTDTREHPIDISPPQQTSKSKSKR